MPGLENLVGAIPGVVLLSNRVAVLLLGVMVGGLLSFGRVGAEAFLLATFEPIYAIYVATAGSLAFSFMLPRVDWDRTKFARIAGFSTFVFALVLGVISLLGGIPSVQAIFWYWLIILSTAFQIEFSSSASVGILIRVTLG